MKNKELKGVLLILIAGALWGTAGLFVRGLNAVGLHAMQIVFVRVAVTAVLTLVGVLIADRSLLKIKLKDVWCFIGTGLVSIVSFYYFYFATIESASIAVAATLLYTAPIFVMAFSLLLFREKLTAQKIAACAVAFVGCVFVSGLIGKGSGLSAASLATGLLSGLGYALYSIFGRYALNKGYSSVTITVYTFVIAAVCLIPFADYAAIAAALSASTAKTLLLGGGLSVFVTVLPYFMYTKGLESVASSKASVMASVEPAVASLISIFVLGENVDFLGKLGIILILAAVVILNIRLRRAKQ